MYRPIPTRIATWIGALSFVVCHGTSQAQDNCEEPTDPGYVVLMDQARAAVAEEDYETALELFQRAGRRYDFVLVDYTIARAYHMLGRYEEAEQTYGVFLDGASSCPDPMALVPVAAEYREEARAAMALAASEAESEEDLDTDPSESETVDEVASENPDSPEAVETEASNEDAEAFTAEPPADGGVEPGWILVGGGSALVVAGVVYDITQADLVDERQDAYDSGDLDEFTRLDDEIRRTRWVEGVLFGVGVAAIGTGFVLLVLNDGDETGTSSVGVSPSRDGALVTYGGRF